MNTSSEDPGELISRFCAQWGTGDYASLLEYFAEDAIYHNIPMEPLQGVEEIKDFLEGFSVDGLRWATCGIHGDSRDI